MEDPVWIDNATFGFIPYIVDCTWCAQRDNLVLDARLTVLGQDLKTDLQSVGCPENVPFTNEYNLWAALHDLNTLLNKRTGKLRDMTIAERRASDNAVARAIGICLDEWNRWNYFSLHSAPHNCMLGAYRMMIRETEHALQLESQIAQLRDLLSNR